MKQIFTLISILLGMLPAVFGQNQPMGSARVLCVKARPGKSAELRQFLTGTTAKMAKYRVENGTYSWFLISEAVAPAGREARCDFHLVYGNDGPPAETKAVTDAEMKSAGLAMTVAQRNAKRDEVSYLVSTEYLTMRDGVGTLQKGGYVRLNYFKVKPGSLQEWTRAERNGWKQMAEVWAKEKAGTAWFLHTVGMPGGAGQAYNAVTVDGYPDWASLFVSRNQRATWMKVHPDSDYSAYMDRIGAMAERPMVATMRLLEIIRK